MFVLGTSVLAPACAGEAGSGAGPTTATTRHRAPPTSSDDDNQIESAGQLTRPTVVPAASDPANQPFCQAYADFINRMARIRVASDEDFIDFLEAYRTGIKGLVAQAPASVKPAFEAISKSLESVVDQQSYGALGNDQSFGAATQQIDAWSQPTCGFTL